MCRQLNQSDSLLHNFTAVGPLAELEYWKQRTAKFSHLVDQLKSHPFKGVLVTIVTAKSKVLKVNDFLVLNTYQFQFHM